MVQSADADSNRPPNRLDVDAQAFGIDSVSLYTGRAVVSRNLTVTLQAGANELVISRLPLLDEDSLQLGGAGVSHVVIHSIDFDVLPEQRAADPAKLQALKDRLADLEDARAGKQTAYDSAAAFSKTFTSEHVPAAKLSEALEAIEANLQCRAEACRKLTKEINEVQDAIRQAEHGTRGPIDPLRGVLTVSLAAMDAGDVELRLEYTVYGAAWEPKYLLRCSTAIETDNVGVELAYKANITQTTGEDWTNVQLKLETVKPTAPGANLPRLYAQRATLQDLSAPLPPPAPTARADTTALFAMSTSSARKKRMRNVAHAEANVLENGPGSSQSFAIAGRSSLLADGRARVVTVANLTLSATLYRAAVPKLDTTAYLQARIKNDSAYTLLPGKVDVTLDGAFVASTSVDLVQPSERFQTHLGADRAVKIDVSEHRENLSKVNAFFSGSTTSKTVSRRITIKNGSQRRRRIEVFDHVPISEDRRIAVECLSPALGAPPASSDVVNNDTRLTGDVIACWAKAEEDSDSGAVNTEGRVRFEVDLAASASTALLFEYQVTWPSEEKLLGI